MMNSEAAGSQNRMEREAENRVREHSVAFRKARLAGKIPARDTADSKRGGLGSVHCDLTLPIIRKRSLRRRRAGEHQNWPVATLAIEGWNRGESFRF
jgi:hypothetical protein